jgi:hypothetical protein
MSVKMCGDKSYHHRSVRLPGGKVTSRYMGANDQGAMQARALAKLDDDIRELNRANRVLEARIARGWREIARARRERERAEFEADCRAVDDRHRSWLAGDSTVAVAVHGGLLALGWHRDSRRVWRRKQGGLTMSKRDEIERVAEHELGAKVDDLPTQVLQAFHDVCACCVDRDRAIDSCAGDLAKVALAAAVANLVYLKIAPDVRATVLSYADRLALDLAGADPAPLLTLAAQRCASAAVELACIELDLHINAPALDDRRRDYRERWRHKAFLRLQAAIRSVGIVRRALHLPAAPAPASSDDPLGLIEILNTRRNALVGPAGGN